MVDKFKQILEKLKEKGKVSLFVVLRMDDFVDKWSVVICSDWAKAGDEASFKEIVDIMSSILNTEERQLIARVGIFNKDDYVAKLFLPYKKGSEIKEKTQINGFVVYEGYVLESSDENEKTSTE